MWLTLARNCRLMKAKPHGAAKMKEEMRRHRRCSHGSPHQRQGRAHRAHAAPAPWLSQGALADLHEQAPQGNRRPHTLAMLLGHWNKCHWILKMFLHTPPHSAHTRLWDKHWPALRRSTLSREVGGLQGDANRNGDKNMNLQRKVYDSISSAGQLSGINKGHHIPSLPIQWLPHEPEARAHTALCEEHMEINKSQWGRSFLRNISHLKSRSVCH